MKTIRTYYSKKAIVVANSLAKERGYDGLASIDDPLLREWILDRAMLHNKTEYSLVVRSCSLPD